MHTVCRKTKRVVALPESWPRVMIKSVSVAYRLSCQARGDTAWLVQKPPPADPSLWPADCFVAICRRDCLMLPDHIDYWSAAILPDIGSSLLKNCIRSAPRWDGYLGSSNIKRSLCNLHVVITAQIAILNDHCRRRSSSIHRKPADGPVPKCPQALAL